MFRNCCRSIRRVSAIHVAQIGQQAGPGRMPVHLGAGRLASGDQVEAGEHRHRTEVRGGRVSGNRAGRHAQALGERLRDVGHGHAAIGHGNRIGREDLGLTGQQTRFEAWAWGER